MKITEENKIKLFSVRSMAKMYAPTHEDFGRYCRGFYQGMLTVMNSVGVKVEDIMPATPPLDPQSVYASFCALYGSYLADEQKPRIDKKGPEHTYLYGKDAQEMMQEAERHLKTIKKANKGRDN